VSETAAEQRDFGAKLAQLRQDFDQGFARPRSVSLENLQDLLLIRLGGEPYAAVVSERAIVPVPGVRSEMLGVAGVRGELFAVFGLAELLGHPAEREAPRWLVLARAEGQVALGFSELDGYLRLAQSQFVPNVEAANAGGEKRSRHVAEVALTASGARPVISMEALVATLREQRRVARSEGEG
jgi:chemotaxis signal transduction protein